jgi:hypothetical protein
VVVYVLVDDRHRVLDQHGRGADPSHLPVGLLSGEDLVSYVMPTWGRSSPYSLSWLLSFGPARRAIEDLASGRSGSRRKVVKGLSALEANFGRGLDTHDLPLVELDEHRAELMLHANLLDNRLLVGLGSSREVSPAALC